MLTVPFMAYSLKKQDRSKLFRLAYLYFFITAPKVDDRYALQLINQVLTANTQA